MTLRVLAGVLLSLCLTSVALAAPLTEAEREAELQKLQWIEAPGSYALTQSKSHLEVVQGQVLLLGSDAARYDELMNGLPAPQTEAVLFAADGASAVYFQYFNEGYIEDDDWDDVDADDFLAQLKETEAETNKVRAQNGVEAFYNRGWREVPSFDHQSKTAFWAIELGNDRQDVWLNASALRLSRNGYEHIVWVGDQAAFPSAAVALTPLLQAHSFDAGARYADYQSGDRTAGYGIGALAAGVLGVKAGKGVLAAIIAFLVIAWKKIAIVLGGVAGIFVWRKRKAKPKA